VAVAELDGKVYVLGGYTEETTSSPLNQVYDPVTDTWEELASMPHGLDHVGAVGYDGKIYAVGGFTAGNKRPVAGVYVYDVGHGRLGGAGATVGPSWLGSRNPTQRQDPRHWGTRDL